MTLIDEVLQSTSRASPDSYAIDNDYVKLPKFRDLEDFLFNIERYSLPVHGNSERLNNRMVNNILYYQSNYLCAFLLTFAGIFYLESKAMILGFTFFAGISYLVNWAMNNHELFTEIQQERKTQLIFGGVVLWFVFMHLLGYIAIFAFGLLFPLLIILTHSALRMRNTRNKLNTARHLAGLKQTPAGIVLNCLGCLDNLRVF